MEVGLLVFRGVEVDYAVDCVNVQLQVPAERLDTLDDLPTRRFVETIAVEVPDEV